LLLRLADVPPGRWPTNEIATDDVARRLELERATVVRVM